MAFELRSQAKTKQSKANYENTVQPIYHHVNKMEETIDKKLDYPVDKAYERRQAYTNLHKGNWVESDKVGHASGAMYTRQAISKKLGGGILGNVVGAVGANILGVGHEIGAFNNDHGLKNGIIEGGKDIVNNFIGSVSSSKNLERNVEKYGTDGMGSATRKERMADMKKDSPLNKQKLSPKAAKAKAERDLAYAKTDDRRIKKAHSQRMHRKNPGNKGKDYDHEDGRFESVKQNRGNEGEGTKKESGKKYKIK